MPMQTVNGTILVNITAAAPAGRLTATIRVNIIPAAVPVVREYLMVTDITPAATAALKLVHKNVYTINATPIIIDISDPIKSTAFTFLRSILDAYIDEERELKTLLNFGEDRQNVVVSYRYGPLDEAGVPTIQLKLLQPVTNDITEGTNAFLSREIAQTIIDKVRFRFAPLIDYTPYLRPKNTAIKVNDQLGKTLKNVTLRLLSLNTGSLGGYSGSAANATFEDSIYRQWYSYDFNSAELNIDFTDYNNFVFYGSAAMRLAAFQQKLREIESLTATQQQFAGSVFTGSLASVGAAYIMQQSATASLQIENTIRSFDRYEQYLYFTPSGSDSPYTASAYYADYGYEYNPIGYWPKDSSGLLYTVDSTTATDWFTSQSAIAQRFDEMNENNLINTIPMHIREDEASGAYITFVAMIGHFFDIIKPYIDQFPNIYDRGLDPNKGLSKDLVTEIAESLGFPLPTLNSIYNLSDNVLGTQSELPRRDYTVESHKRLLHNLPFFAKAKGTRTALTTLLKTLGITDQILTVRESGTSESGSLNMFDEFSTGLTFTGTPNSHVIIPVSASNRTPRPQSIQFNLTVGTNQNVTVANGDTKWALNVMVHPTNPVLGRFELTSGSSQTVLLSSSYHDIFGDQLLNVAIRTYDTGSYANLHVTQVEGDDVIFEDSMSETYGAGKFVPLWSSSANIYVGGSGSLVTGSYNGTIDELRLWGTNLSDEVVMNTAFDPGSCAGDSYTDASDYLYVQLSFNRIVTSSLPTFLVNETPYKYVDGSPSLENIYLGNNITINSFTRYNRTVRQILPDVGSSGYVTKKIHVVPPPVFGRENLTPDGVKQLSRTSSIVKKSQKKIQVGRNKVSVSTSPTQIIDQNIIRTLGLENINAVLGSPTDLYNAFTTSLETLKRHYSQYYYVDVNINRYIRILSDVNSVLNQVVEYFIPSKATLLRGVTIEPNVLERVKIPPLQNFRFYGANARRTLNAPGSLTGSNADYGATFNLKQTIDATSATTATGSYDSYTSQLEFTPSTNIAAETALYRGALSSSTQEPTAEYVTYPDATIDYQPGEPAGVFEVFAHQHEDWYTAGLISQSLRPPHPASIAAIDNVVSGSYSTYKSVLPTDAVQSISGSFNVFYGGVVSDPLQIVTVDTLYLLCHDMRSLDWREFRDMSNSIASGSTPPMDRTRIDLGLSQLNKIKYDDVNKGSEGAEPYNRVYARKLYDYEIDATRAGGVTSLYIPALYVIPPSSDFTELGAHTYFNSPTGIYYYPKIAYQAKPGVPLNHPWNGTTFVGAGTWSYGSSYKKNDVAYQYVTKADVILGAATQSARLGNGNYYRFTTQPDYVQPADGTAWYSGSVPTFNPPSLDTNNWTKIKFQPFELREARREVFDTFTIPDPALNNFNTTTIDVNKVIDVPDRYVDINSIGNINSGSFTQGSILAQNVSALFAIQASVGSLRIRLYRTFVAATADLSRDMLTLPSENAGVLLDTQIISAGTVQVINPIVTLVADSLPPLGKLFYTINNLTSTTQADITLLLYYFALQIEPRVPSGYLRKHYRFFRDNSTATKRRNYVGCKNTVDTTVDGLPPVQIFIGEGTSIIVSPTQTNNEITTGGGGTLNVT